MAATDGTHGRGADPHTLGRVPHRWRLLLSVETRGASELPFLRQLGFVELTRTTRGWIRAR